MHNFWTRSAAHRASFAIALIAVAACAGRPEERSAGATADASTPDAAAPSPAVRTAQAATPSVAVPTSARPAAGAVGAPVVTVYKDPNCGCCKNWEEHLREHGFEVVSHDTRDMAGVKARLGVGDALASCHTAVVGGYVVEGHVPASDIHRLLEERPKVAGLAVPGMPMGSPGMEGPRKDAYDVLAFDAAGGTRVFSSH